MIYLYVTPSGSVNLIEGDKMPKEPVKYWGVSDKLYAYDTQIYEDAIESAKASSVPVDDQDAAWKLIFQEPQMQSMTSFKYNPADGCVSYREGNQHYSRTVPQDVYGPFDIGYEIGHRCTYLQTDGKCDDCFRNNLCAKVAILKEKEPVKQQTLVEAQQEYIDLLLDEINSLVGIAHVHGWRSSNVEKGKAVREKIELAKAVGKLEEKETPEQFYARSRYPEMKDKFDKSAARFSYDDMMQFAEDYTEAVKRGSL